MVIISGLADMISNTVSQYYRCANDWIPKKQNKGSTYHSRYQSFHQINFIWKHSSSSSSYTRWSDRFANLVSLQCWNWFYYVVVTHRKQKSSLWIFKSIDSFRLGINTKKYSWDGLSAYLKKSKLHSFWVFTLRNVVKRYEYDVITWSTAVKLRAQLEPVSANGGREIRKFIAAFFYLNCDYIQFYLHRRMFYD